jgi:hypothetical protein
VSPSRKLSPAERAAPALPATASRSRNELTGLVNGAVLQASSIGAVYLNDTRAPVPLPARQVRAPGSHWTNRRAELAQMDTWMQRDTGQGPPVAVLNGMAGVGSSALAARWLTGNADAFTDGLFHVDFSHPGRLTVGDALGHLLRSAGVSAAELPDLPADRAAHWRTVSARLRAAILVEHPASVADVLTLLPASATCVTIVTRRRTLLGLLPHGAHMIQLRPLDDATATQLLNRHLAPYGITADPAVAADITALCGGHPLAVGLAAALLITRPQRPARAAVDALLTELTRLDTTMNGEPPVLAGIQASVAQLSPAARDACRAVALAPGASLTVDGVAAAMDVGRSAAQAALSNAVTASLIQEDGSLYRCHPLVRQHLRALCTTPSTSPSPGTGTGLDAPAAAMVERILQWYLDCARLATETVMPSRRQLPHKPPAQARAAPPELLDYDTARRWLEQQRRNLAAAVEQAHLAGLDQIAILLADATQLPVIHYGDTGLGAQADRTALLAAHRSGDTAHIMRITKRLARVWINLGDLHTAARYHQDHQLLADRSGSRAAQASAHKTAGLLLAARGEPLAAVAALDKTVTIWQDIGHQRGEALALIVQATFLLDLDDADTAFSLLTRAHGLLMALSRPDPYNAARAETEMARVHVRRGNPDAAEECLSTALATMHELGATAGQARVHDLWAELADRTSRVEDRDTHRAAAHRLRALPDGAS